ncbi:MAG: HAD family phosphatase [Sedimentisphaerales bacterium]|nr:HAD family phosphatase [Sedimentisphaerales bacterium]
MIFDLDGVLVDTGWAHRQSWYDLAQREGLDMSDEFFRDTFGLQNYAIIPRLKPGIGPKELERLSDWKEQRYRAILADRLELADGVETLLEDLKGHGFRLAIGSSAPRENLDVFWHPLGLARYFDARVTKEEVAEGKPSPRTFLKAAEKLGLPPRACVVVEDAVAGLQAGVSAGMAVVAITTTRRRADLAQADCIIDRFAELKADDFVALLNGR